MASIGRILLVEDDKYFNKLLFDRLSLEGLSVESVLDGETAWSKLEEARLQSRPFEILISDMLIPRLMGAELFSRIRESSNHSDLSLIAISGIYKDPSQIQEISALHGLRAYWTKPFDINAFVRALKDPSLAEEAREVSHQQQQKDPAPATSASGGDLQKTKVEPLFFQAYHEGFTGKLIIKAEASDRNIYFSNGFPVSVESSLINESLGYSLVEFKVIDRDTQEKASEMMVLQGLQFGQMLLKMGALTKDQLFQGIRKHTYRLLLNTFLWKEGKIQWERMSALPDYVLPLEFNPMILILKAHRSLYSADFLKQLFQSKSDSYPVLAPAAVQILPLFNLDASSLQFLSHLPSNQAFSETAKKIPSAAQESFWRVLFALESIQLLEWRLEAQVGNQAPVQRAHFEEAFHASEKTKDARTQMLARLQAEYMELLGQTYFQVFELPESLPINHEHLEETYRNLRVRYHPDRIDAQLVSGEVQRILDDMLARIDRAYQTLSNEDSQKTYLGTLKSQREDSAADSKRYLEAQDKYREGGRLLANQDFEGALRSFRAAQKVWNRAEEYELYALYSEFRIAYKKGAPDVELQKCISKLKAAASDNKISDLGFVLLGHSYSVLHKQEQAKEAYQMALKVNEANEEASLALANLGQKAFKDERISRVLKSSKNRIRQMLTYSAVLLGALTAFITKDHWLTKVDPDVSIYKIEELKFILPVVTARGKPPVAKVVIEEGKLAPIPDAVLLTKCLQLVQKLKEHGILEVYLLDQKEGLKAQCQGEKLRRYAK